MPPGQRSVFGARKGRLTTLRQVGLADWLLRPCWVLALVLSFCGSGPRRSSSALPAALERPSDVRPETRAELRRELERHAEVLEAQSAVLKIVAKLIGPSVVHIEADIRPADGENEYTSASRRNPARA